MPKAASVPRFKTCTRCGAAIGSWRGECDACAPAENAIGYRQPSPKKTDVAPSRSSKAGATELDSLVARLESSQPPASRGVSAVHRRRPSSSPALAAFLLVPSVLTALYALENAPFQRPCSELGCLEFALLAGVVLFVSVPSAIGAVLAVREAPGRVATMAIALILLAVSARAALAL